MIDGELVVISGDAGSFLVIPSSSTYLEIFIFMDRYEVSVVCHISCDNPSYLRDQLIYP